MVPRWSRQSESCEPASTMYTLDYCIVGGLWFDNRAQLAHAKLLQHIVPPRGHFKTWHQPTTKNFQLAVVQGVLVVVYAEHGISKW